MRSVSFKLRPGEPGRPRGGEWLCAAALLGLAGLVCVPLGRGDFYLSHDLLFWPYRLWELDRCLHDGQVFARWFPDFAWGRGMPFLNFYAPLFLYLAEGLHLAGFTLLGALKAAVFLILAGSSLGMYLLARQGQGREASLVAGASYMFGPYLLTVVYLRGGLAEALGFVWLPFCLLALRKAVTEGRPALILFSGASLAALMLTHNITAMLFLPIALAYGIVAGWGRPGAGWRLAACFSLGLGLSCFFWLPALAERGYVRMEDVVADRYQYQHNFASLPHLWDITGERIHPLTEDGVHLALGGPQMLLALLSLAAVWKVGSRRREILFFWVVLVSALFMIFRLSQPVWAALPPLRFAQFPWRWMGICTFSLAYLSGAGVNTVLTKANGKSGIGVLALLGSLVLLVPSLVAAWGGHNSAATLPLAAVTLALGGALYLAGRKGGIVASAGPGIVSLFFLGLIALFFIGQQGPLPESVKPTQLTEKGWLFWEEKSGFVGTTIMGEYLPKAAPREALPVATQRLHPGAGEGVSVKELRHWSAGLEAEVSALERSVLIYEQFYFPGWQAWVDQKPARVEVNREGLISLAVPAGKHRVEVRFGFTKVRLAATLVSYLALVAAALLAVRWRGRRFGRGTPTR